jgi:hypothetical protein
VLDSNFQLKASNWPVRANTTLALYDIGLALLSLQTVFRQVSPFGKAKLAPRRTSTTTREQLAALLASKLKTCISS